MGPTFVIIASELEFITDHLVNSVKKLQPVFREQERFFGSELPFSIFCGTPANIRV